MKVIFVLKCKIITNNKRGSMKINEGIQYTVTEILYMPQWENEWVEKNWMSRKEFAFFTNKPVLLKQE
jgi:hypothetical protein